MEEEEVGDGGFIGGTWLLEVLGRRAVRRVHVDLHGQVDVILAGRIDSVDGGIRTSFESVPDAPVSKFVLEMQGGKKGLIVNSTNLCKGPNRATVKFTGQNGKTSDFHPVVLPECPHKKK